MLKFSEQAFSELARGTQDLWLQRAMCLINERHPEWARSKNPEQIRELCLEADRFSEVYDLHQEVSFFFLIAMVIENNFNFKISPFERELCLLKGFSEHQRLELLREEIALGRATKILNNF